MKHDIPIAPDRLDVVITRTFFLFLSLSSCVSKALTTYVRYQPCICLAGEMTHPNSITGLLAAHRSRPSGRQTLDFIDENDDEARLILD